MRLTELNSHDSVHTRHNEVQRSRTRPREMEYRGGYGELCCGGLEFERFVVRRERALETTVGALHCCMFLGLLVGNIYEGG